MDTTPLLGDPSTGLSTGFYRRVYRYRRNNGVACTLAATAVDLVVSLYVLLIALFLAGGAVDYGAIWHRVAHPECPDGTRNTASLFAAGCHGERPVDAARLRAMPAAVALAVALCAALWLWAAAAAIDGVPRLLQMQAFYRDKLEIPDSVLPHTEWATIIQKLVDTSTRTHLQIVHCITRYADYETAMLNDGVLDVGLWVPGAGTVPYFPESLQANLRHAVTKAIERPQYGDVGGTASDLAWTLRALAALNLLLAPGLLVYRLAHYTFRYADEWRRRPGLLATRQWSPWARRRLRQFSELDEELDARLAAARPIATAYIDSVASPLATVLARGVATVCGGLVALLVGFAMVYDEEFLTLDFTRGRSVAFWIGAAGAVLAAASAALTPPPTKSPAELLGELTRVLRHAPPGWRRTAHTAATYAEVARLFPYRAVVLLTELLSVVLTPYLLWRVAGDAGAIARYLADTTVTCPVAGAVCRHARFEAQGAAALSKVELSLLQFQSQHAGWQPANEWQRSVVDDRERVLERSIGRAESVQLN